MSQERINELATELGKLMYRFRKHRQATETVRAQINSIPVTVPVSVPAGYSQIVTNLTPALWFPMQEMHTDTIKATTGESAKTKGLTYVDDTWAIPQAPDALGRYVTVPTDGSTDSGFTLQPDALGKLQATLKSGVWSYVENCRIDGELYGQTLFGATGTNGVRVALQFSNSEQLQFSLDGVTVQSATIPNPYGSWHVVGVTVNAGTATLYWDGAPVGTGTVPSWSPTALAKGYIGSLNGDGSQGNAFVGSLTQTGWFSSALTADDHDKLFDVAFQEMEEVPERGVSAYYGTNANYFGAIPTAKALADNNVPLVLSWWEGYPADLADRALEAEGFKIGLHTNPGDTPEAYRANGQLMIPDAIQMPTAFNGDLTKANNYPDVIPLFISGDEQDMKDQVPDQAIADHAKIPAGFKSYQNWGTGATLGVRSREQMRAFAAIPDIAVVSADLYFQCMKQSMADQCLPVYGSKDRDVMRHPAWYARVPERIRTFLPSPKVIISAVGIGHANTRDSADASESWCSVPSADEVEASCMAGLLGGASGVLLFPQSFNDPVPDPVWSATATYKRWDQVHSAKNPAMHYWCNAVPPVGFDPDTDTDGTYWLRWSAADGDQVDNPLEHAQGVPQAVKRQYTFYKAMTSVIQQPRVRINAAAGVWAVKWENVGGKSYMFVMQAPGHTSGTYTLRMPASAAGKTVSVDYALRHPAKTTRTVSTSNTITETFKSHSDYFFYSWTSTGGGAASTTTTTVKSGTSTTTTTAASGFKRNLIAHIGDSLSDEPGRTFMADKFKSVASFQNVAWYSAYTKEVNLPDTNKLTTVQNVKDIRAAGQEPDVWSFALGTDMDLSITEAQAAALDVSGVEAQVNAVLAEVDKGGKKPVIWTGIATVWSYPNDVHIAINAMLKRVMEARGKYGFYADWWQYTKDNCIDLGKEDVWFRDGVHMTTDGYTIKANWLPSQVNAYITSKLS